MGSTLPVKVALLFVLFVFWCTFVCVVHLFPGGEEGALFLYNVLMVGSITYVHRLPNMALKPLAANVPPRRMKGYF